MCDILNKFDNNGAVGSDSEDIMASPSQNSPMANVSTNSVPSNVGNSSNSGTNTLASNNNNSNSSNNGAGSSSNTSATSKPATAAERQPILTNPRLLELVREVDVSAQLDEDVEELLLQVVKKSIALLGCFPEQSDTDKALAIFEKQAFRESEVATESEQSGQQLLEKNCENNVKDTSLMSYFCGDLKVQTEFINDIYGSYQCVPPVELSGFFTTCILTSIESTFKT
uniref:Transcription initiation factor TFIID subunit 12 domain-containing protein n=1 Tax=Glossina palpalis gambiensis TaxID=67801 RepID=A0A1B0BTG2_9MUSC